MTDSVEIGRREIRIDGEPVQILSGAMHYFRIHPACWRDRIVKLRQCGLNTLETYLAWNFHEPREGEFNFSGAADFVRYLEIAQEEGLMAILRPGPYICSEWDLGGLPAWLLAKPGMRLRCMNGPYLEAADRYLDAIMPALRRLQHTAGGPVIAVQLENEYGSYGDDRAYLRHLEKKYRDGGITVPLFTSDGADAALLRRGSLPGVFPTANFRNHPARQLNAVRELRDDAPLFAMELWCGGAHHWGRMYPEHAAEAVAEDVREVLENGYHMNLYMFHGGSNPGFMNGANFFQGEYFGMLSTYDVDAPLSEEGDPTPKYFAIQREIKRFHPGAKTGTPAVAPKRSYGEIALTEAVMLDDALAGLPAPFRGAMPETMEAFGQSYGFIHYRNRLEGAPGVRTLRLEGLRDRAVILADGRIAGIIHRNDRRPECSVAVPPGGLRLDILVENTGRINFGPEMERERKGITGVLEGGAFLMNWEIRPLPLADLSFLDFRPLDAAVPPEAPAFYRGGFAVDEPCDTFLKVPDGSWGNLFLNGVNLGRFRREGPQRTLYVPAALLRRGRNEVVVFDVQGLGSPRVLSLDKRQFGPRALMQI